MKKFTSSFITQYRYYLCNMLDALLEAKEISKESDQCKHLYDEYRTNIISTGQFILGVVNGHHYIRDNFTERLSPPLITRCKAISKASSTWVYGYAIDSFEIRDDDYHYHEVYSNTIGQFFGKYDTNGIEVYTGDIILHTSPTCNTCYVVCYDVDSATFVGKNSVAGTVPIADILHSSEVIGNIYILNDIDPDII